MSAIGRLLYSGVALPGRSAAKPCELRQTNNKVITRSLGVLCKVMQGEAERRRVSDVRR